MGNSYMADDKPTSGKIDKGSLEREWANHEARLILSPDDRAAWDDMRYVVRPFVYYDKIFIVWHLVKGEPQVKDIFTATTVDASFRDGLWVRLRSSVTSQECIVSHRPRRLLDSGVFVWVPFFTEVRFVSADWSDPAAPRNMRLSICAKMRHNHELLLEERCDYLTELHSFRARFPQYRDTKF